MGMTMTQKILAAHAGLDSVEAGQLIEADLDTIKAAGYPATTMVILTNADQYSEVVKTEPGAAGTDTAIMKLKK